MTWSLRLPSRQHIGRRLVEFRERSGGVAKAGRVAVLTLPRAVHTPLFEGRPAPVDHHVTNHVLRPRGRSARAPIRAEARTSMEYSTEYFPVLRQADLSRPCHQRRMAGATGPDLL